MNINPASLIDSYVVGASLQEDLWNLLGDLYRYDYFDYRHPVDLGKEGLTRTKNLACKILKDPNHSLSNKYGAAAWLSLMVNWGRLKLTKKPEVVILQPNASDHTSWRITAIHEHVAAAFEQRDVVLPTRTKEKSHVSSV